MSATRPLASWLRPPQPVDENAPPPSSSEPQLRAGQTTHQSGLTIANSRSKPARNFATRPQAQVAEPQSTHARLGSPARSDEGQLHAASNNPTRKKKKEPSQDVDVKPAS